MRRARQSIPCELQVHVVPVPARGPPHGRTQRATNTRERYQRAQHRPNHIIRAAATGGTHPRGILKHASFCSGARIYFAWVARSGPHMDATFSCGALDNATYTSSPGSQQPPVPRACSTSAHNGQLEANTHAWTRGKPARRQITIADADRT
jgi:hypothetical protein